MEIEKRKQAEEALSNMQKKWQNIRQQLSLAGLTLPADSTTSVEGREQTDFDAGEELCRQVYLARFVADSIGRGLARAELEAEMEVQLEAKNFEIARLCDKLRNYEAMNQEMVQRNQDVLGKVFIIKEYLHMFKDFSLCDYLISCHSSFSFQRQRGVRE